MNHLTIGQRIASRRKLLNLSQETLAERLGVSRQAVSKWESDAAIPEIDKLIALAKLYEVSVGWLLGVEEQESPQADSLSESQLKMVEEIVRRYQAPRKKRAVLGSLALLLCFFLALSAFSRYYRQQNETLAAKNESIQEQIGILSAGNAELQAQVSSMTSLLSAQNEATKLLRSYVPMGYLSADLQSVDLTFYFFPKLYQEDTTAYLSIRNPVLGTSEMLQCSWGGDRYFVHATLPLADHYQYSFLLADGGSYEEELLDQNTYFSDLLTHSRFYIAEGHPKYAQMRSGESSPISTEETVYCYDAPLYMPCIQEKNGYVPFRDVTIALLLDDAVLWEQDYTEDFLALYKKENISLPLEPDISLDLPALESGGRLLLTLTATTHTGRTMVTTLDDLTVMS